MLLLLLLRGQQCGFWASPIKLCKRTRTSLSTAKFVWTQECPQLAKICKSVNILRLPSRRPFSCTLLQWVGRAMSANSKRHGTHAHQNVTCSLWMPMSRNAILPCGKSLTNSSRSVSWMDEMEMQIPSFLRSVKGLMIASASISHFWKLSLPYQHLSADVTFSALTARKHLWQRSPAFHSKVAKSKPPRGRFCENNLVWWKSSEQAEHIFTKGSPPATQTAWQGRWSASCRLGCIFL